MSLQISPTDRKEVEDRFPNAVDEHGFVSNREDQDKIRVWLAERKRERRAMHVLRQNSSHYFRHDPLLWRI